MSNQFTVTGNKSGKSLSKYLTRPSYLKTLGAVSMMALSAGSIGAVQAEDQGDDELVLEEIIVTAQLRAANVQDVPVTVSVLGGDMIATQDIFDATGIARHTPGLSYGEFAPGQAILSMRGVASTDDGAGLDSSVAVFLDGVYIGRGAGANFDMFDLQRIEVLKGPQGALFGRNTIGGAISVVTKKPSAERMAKFGVTVGNEGIIRGQGLLNGALSENLMGKVVVNYRHHNGFVTNTLLDKKVNDENYISVRGQLLLELDSSSWTLSADYMDDDREDAGRFPFINGNFDYVGTAEALGAGRKQTTASPLEGFTKREVKGISLTGEMPFDSGTFTSITALRNVQTDWEMPSVGAPLGGGYDLAAGVYGLDVIDKIEEEVDTFSQEFRWTSKLGGDVEFVTGLFFFKEDTDRPEQWNISRNSEATGQVIVGNEYARTINETTSFAAYGQAQWSFAPDWTLSVGGRYSYDKKEYQAQSVNCGLDEATRAAAGFPNFAPCEGVGGSLRIIAEVFDVSGEESWTDFSPMASLQYRMSDQVMVFGTVSTGYKSGGFAGSQGVEAAASVPVDPENVTNYELGMKGDFLDNSMRLNVTAFYMKYKDLQVTRFGPVPSSPFGTFLTTNLGSAKIKGLEMEMTWQMTENLTFNANYAYLDSEAQDLVINGIDASGTQLRQAPENSFNLDLNYHVPLDKNGTLDFNIHFSHVDEERMDYISDNPVIEERNLTDARITWRSDDDRYEVSLWGQNLFDKGYTAHTYIIGPGSIGVWGAPRTFGISMNASF